MPIENGMPPSTWYILKQPEGHCRVVERDPTLPAPDLGHPSVEHWGPFPSREEAVARRVGLIRAGKCQPV